MVAVEERVDQLGLLLGSLPAGVAVVTTRDDDGRPRGLTATSVCRLSSDPPTVLVCVDLGSRTLPALRSTGRFVISVLRAGRDELSARFASKEQDKFGGVAWRATPSGLPFLPEDSLAWLECATVRELDAGDHAVLVARIENGANAAGGLPLVSFRRRLGTWAPSRPVTVRSTRSV